MRIGDSIGVSNQWGASSPESPDLEKIRQEIKDLKDLSGKTDPASRSKFETQMMQLQMDITNFLGNNPPITDEMKDALKNLPAMLNSIEQMSIEFKNNNIRMLEINKELAQGGLTDDQRQALINERTNLEGKNQVLEMNLQMFQTSAAAAEKVLGITE